MTEIDKQIWYTAQWSPVGEDDWRSCGDFNSLEIGLAACRQLAAKSRAWPRADVAGWPGKVEYRLVRKTLIEEVTPHA